MKIFWRSHLIRIASALPNRALNLFLKSNCPLCDRASDDVFCRYCQRQIEECRLTRSNIYWQGELPLFAWGKYEGVIKQSIAKFKYDKYRAIGDVYGELLARSWQQFSSANLEHKLIVMPIPLHAEKLAIRGFNQAELISRKFADLTGAKLNLNLHRTRSTVAQFGLSKADRQANVADAFALTGKPIGSEFKVLLIDDIYTTGATARSAATTLRSQGINVLGIAVVATGKALD